jgi:hypothetical protein
MLPGNKLVKEQISRRILGLRYVELVHYLS